MGSNFGEQNPDVINPHDWNDLVTERAGIMQHDAGMPEPKALAMAWQDTVTAFGNPPLLYDPAAPKHGQPIYPGLRSREYQSGTNNQGRTHDPLEAQQ